MAAIGKFGILLAFVSLLVIVFYLLPNKESIENIRNVALVIGMLFFFGLFLTIFGVRAHGRKHGWWQ